MSVLKANDLVPCLVTEEVTAPPSMEETTQFAIYRVRSKNVDDSRFLDVPFLLFEEEELGGAIRRHLTALGNLGVKLRKRERNRQIPANSLSQHEAANAPVYIMFAPAISLLLFEFEC